MNMTQYLIGFFMACLAGLAIGWIIRPIPGWDRKSIAIAAIACATGGGLLMGMSVS